MRDLVVARERRVDRGPALHHVLEHAVDDQVADEHAHRAAHQRVVAAAVTARPHVAALGAARRRDLEHDLPEEEHEDARHVEAVREEGPVARVRLLLLVHPADGEDAVVGLAREQVAAARAAVAEQAVTGMATLDLGAVGRRRAGHRRRGLLLDPAERRDVLVRAEQDAGLRRTRLRGEIRLPLRQRVAALDEPAGHVRRVAVAHRALQHGQREAVDLEVDDARRIRLDEPVRALRDPLDHAQGVGVVVVRPEDDVEHDRDGRRHERDSERRPERVDREVAVRDAVGREQHQRVEDQDEQEPGDEHQRQPQRGDDRRQQCVEDRDHRCRDERSAPALDMGAGDDPRGDEQGDRREDPRDDDPHEPDARALGRPHRLLRRSPSSSSRHALTRSGHDGAGAGGRVAGAASGAGTGLSRAETMYETTIATITSGVSWTLSACEEEDDEEQRDEREAEHRHGHRTDSHRRTGDHRQPGRCDSAIPTTAPTNMPGNTGPPRKPLSASE